MFQDDLHRLINPTYIVSGRLLWDLVLVKRFLDWDQYQRRPVMSICKNYVGSWGPWKGEGFHVAAVKAQASYQGYSGKEGVENQQ